MGSEFECSVFELPLYCENDWDLTPKLGDTQKLVNYLKPEGVKFCCFIFCIHLKRRKVVSKHQKNTSTSFGVCKHQGAGQNTQQLGPKNCG